MYIYAENLMVALRIAIQEREQPGERDSAIVAGWRQALEALENGKSLEIRR